jgi:hypothetical protein
MIPTNGASTRDWIGQIEGGVIYAHDLGVSLGAIGITVMPDNPNLVLETVHKYKTRFKEAWEELSEK